MQKIHTIMLLQVEGRLCRYPFFAIEKRQVFLKLWFQVISIFEKLLVSMQSAAHKESGFVRSAMLTDWAWQ